MTSTPPPIPEPRPPSVDEILLRRARYGLGLVDPVAERGERRARLASWLLRGPRAKPKPPPFVYFVEVVSGRRRGRAL